jgi:hypothetical protein
VIAVVPQWRDRLCHLLGTTNLTGPWMLASVPFYTVVDAHAIGFGGPIGGKSTIKRVHNVPWNCG